MIQAYKRENTQYRYNGDMVLLPEKCVLKAELNGAWVLELTHPIDGEGRWKYLKEEAVVCAPTFQGKKQLFRISRIEKEDGGITATAYPVFFDSADDHFLMDVRPEAKNGQQALDILTAGSRYSGSSDITSVATAYFVRRNLMDAINGEEGPTFIQRWGGEILYDNFTVIINEKVGGDYGTEIRYGKNMAGIEEDVDMSDVITRIVPVAYNGHTMSGDTPWVDSPHISKYAKIYTREIRFEDVKMEADVQEDSGDGECIVCKSQEELDTALKQKCREQYASGIDLPSVSIRVSMADISKTEEYKGYEGLETVRLGDTVFCRNKRLDITTAERAVGIEWDCIRDCVSEVTLSSVGKECFSGMVSAAARVDSAIRSDGSVMAERVRGLLNAMDTQLRFQKNIAQRQDVRAILFEDMDEESPTYGAMCLGTQGFQISNRRTADGRDWDWTTAFTAQGGYADALVLGILSDKTGTNYWNLDTGEFFLSSETGIGDETVGSILTKIGANAGAIIAEVKRAEGAEKSLGTQFAQTIESIQLSVTNSTTSATITLSGDGISAQSATIRFTGEIVFASSLADGTTKVSGSNISGGTLSLGSSNNGYGKLRMYDASNRLMGSWDNRGLFTNDTVIIGDLCMAGTVAYSLDVDAAERVKARVMNLAFGTSSTGTTGEYVLYIGYPNYNWKVTEARAYIPFTFVDSVTINKSLKVLGTKERVVETQHYSQRSLYAYEMASPIFGDIGEGITDENGDCYVCLDDIFLETTAAGMEYQVFLQKEGPGDVWVQQKLPAYFIVKGTPDLKFAWEVKAKQKGYELNRLEDNVDRRIGFYEGPESVLANERETFINEQEKLLMDERQFIIEEREELLYETA